MIDTTVRLSGTPETIASILNGAMKMLSELEITIRPDEGVDTVNLKIRQAEEYMSGFASGFTLVDFLDDTNRMDCPYEDWVLSYIDEEDPDGSENYDVHIMGVTGDGKSRTLTMESHVRESQRSYSTPDWCDWCTRMVHIYGVMGTLERQHPSQDADADDETFEFA